MRELKSLWDRIEKWAILAVLLTFFGLQIVAEFVPEIDTFMDRRGSLVLIALSLLFIFRYMSEKLDPLTSKNLEHIGVFTQGVIDFLSREKQYETIDLLANNGFMYFIAIRESKVKIKNLRLLLRGVDNLDAMQFPSDNKSKQDYKQQLGQMLQSWKQLKQSGQVENLEIRFYPFDSVMYLMVTNGRRLHFGFLRPLHIHPGTEIMNSFATDDTSYPGKEITNDCKQLFETIWQEFGEGVP